MTALPLQRAIDLFGSQVRFAEALRPYVTRITVKQQHVSKWLSTSVPPEYCRAIEHVTHGRVTRYELRPDVFGPAYEPAGASRPLLSVAQATAEAT
jgi:DNA-binding transcriptional regulator YdaS (Cro superfamily)